MCQAYDGEKQFVIANELSEIRKKWEAHKSGEHPLTDEEIKALVIQKLMLEEG